MKTPDVSTYVSQLKQWQPETEALRTLLLDCGFTEELKWRKPCYTFRDKNVVIIQGFKPHCALMFFKGALLSDPNGLLVAQGPNSESAKRVEITSVNQIERLEPSLRVLLAEAKEIEDKGLKLPKSTKKTLEFPPELVAAFEIDPTFKAAFDELTPGRQRGYTMHFSSAKNASTRANRIAKYLPRIVAGKRLND